MHKMLALMATWNTGFLPMAIDYDCVCVHVTFDRLYAWKCEKFYQWDLMWAQMLPTYLFGMKLVFDSMWRWSLWFM